MLQRVLIAFDLADSAVAKLSLKIEENFTNERCVPKIVITKTLKNSATKPLILTPA